MTKQIKIVGGKKGWHLKVNGLYINHSFNNKITAIKCEFGIPYGSTEWVSVNAIRDFWSMNRNFIVASLDKPCKSVWGQLEFIAI